MANAGFFSILVIKLYQSCQLCLNRGQVIDTNVTPESVSEHEELYSDIPPVQRKSKRLVALYIGFRECSLR